MGAGRETVPSRKGEDAGWEARFVARWRGGEGVPALCREFRIPEAVGMALAKTQIRKREARPSDFDDVTWRLSGKAAVHEMRQGRPCEEDDAAYVAACLKLGGFPAAEVVDGRALVTWPDLAARARSLAGGVKLGARARIAHRTKAEAGR